jgi:hypothetical protein
MDDDEKQMLQEARARLANTRGKKAKRKAREKMMEETRRLSQLQKDRELRAAGLSTSSRRVKKGEMDYNQEIPFETLPQLGAHAYGAEENPRPNKSIQQVNLEQQEHRTRMEEEKRLRREDKRMAKKIKETEMPEDVVAEQVAADLAFRKVSQLVLPEVEDSDSSDEASSDKNEDEGYRPRQMSAKNLLNLLPAVENEIDIDFPKVPEEETEEPLVPDRGDILISAKSVEESRWCTSQVIQRGLPRLVKIELSETSDAVNNMILEEVNRLILTDAIEHPISRPLGRKKDAVDRSAFSLAELKAAAGVIEAVAEGIDPVPVESVIVTSRPWNSEAEKILSKTVHVNAIKIGESRTVAQTQLGGFEEQIFSIDNDIRMISLEIANLKRHHRVMVNSAAGQDAQGESLMEDMKEKLGKEKGRNKQHQDRYMRLVSFIKQIQQVV